MGRCGLDFDEAEEMPDSERQPLRHALMDRCQAHVAWLLRLEREQRSIDRMARLARAAQTSKKRASSEDL